MSTLSKIITLLILGGLFVLVITHPGGFATDSTAGGKVLDTTLKIETGSGVATATGGQNMGKAA